ncbi:MAG: hypothetical protein ACI93N_000420 [Flavobacteriaceae bacterium]
MLELFDEEMYNIFDYQISEKPYLIEYLSPETTYQITISSRLCNYSDINGAPSDAISVLTNE